jgi:hypothetical protein
MQIDPYNTYRVNLSNALNKSLREDTLNQIKFVYWGGICIDGLKEVSSRPTHSIDKLYYDDTFGWTLIVTLLENQYGKIINEYGKKFYQNFKFWLDDDQGKILCSPLNL